MKATYLCGKQIEIGDIVEFSRDPATTESWWLVQFQVIKICTIAPYYHSLKCKYAQGVKMRGIDNTHSSFGELHGIGKAGICVCRLNLITAKKNPNPLQTYLEQQARG